MQLPYGTDAIASKGNMNVWKETKNGIQQI